MQKIFKKPLALFVSVMLSITCFAVIPFSSMAAGAGIRVVDESNASVTVYNKNYVGTAKFNKSYNDTSFAAAIDNGKNIIRRRGGAAPNFLTEQVLDGGTTGSWVNGKYYDSSFTSLTDGNAGTSMKITKPDYNTNNGPARWIFNSEIPGMEYRRFYYVGGGEYSSTRVKAIELYFSDNLDTLFNASNKAVYVVNNEGDSPKKYYTDIAFDPAGDLPKGQYVGINSLGTTDWQTWYELGLETNIDSFSAKFTNSFNAVATTTYANADAFGATFNKDNNLLKNAAFSFNLKNNQQTGNLYDGNLTNDCRYDSSALPSDYHVTIALKKTYEISRMYLLTPSNYTGFNKYEIYVSNDSATLFDASNKVYTMEGSRMHSITFDGSVKPTGGYVGINVPSGQYSLINEFGVEGTTTTQTDSSSIQFYTNYPSVSLTSVYADNDAFLNTLNKDTNLLVNSDITFSHSYPAQQVVENLYDKNLSTDCRYYSDAQDIGFNITVDMKKAYQITRVYLATASYPALNTMDIYASNDKSTLFNAANKVYHIEGTYKQSVTFGGEEKPTARYVGFKCPNGIKQGTVVQEFGVEGIGDFEPTFVKPESVSIETVSSGFPGTPYSFKINITDDKRLLDTVKIGDEDLVPVGDIYTITDTTSPVTVTITDKSALESFDVKFVDKMKNVIYETTVEEGSTLTPEDIARAELAVPEIYGYEKRLDPDTGAQIWNNDITAIIAADTTFQPLYAKSNTVYKVNFFLDGKLVETKKVKFNTLVNFHVKGLTAAYVGETLIAVADSNELIEFFVSGNMDVILSKDAVSDQPAIGFIGDAVTGVDKDGTNNMTVFVHIDNINMADIVEYGIVFTSKTQYDKIQDKTVDWTTVIDNDKCIIAKFENVISGNFMATLSKITNTKAVTRYAQAYVKLKDGNVYVTKNAIFGAFNYN